MARALELALREEFDEAQAVLAPHAQPIAVRLSAFLKKQQVREGRRTAEMSKARHEVGNALSIAQASLEAMLDGVVGITDPRLNRLRDILSHVSASMYELTSKDSERGAPEIPQPGGDPIAEEVAALTTVAGASGIRLSYTRASGSARSLGKAESIPQAFRTVLLHALRHTGKGGSVDVRCTERDEIIVNVASRTAGKVLETSSHVVSLLQDDGVRAELLLTI